MSKKAHKSAIDLLHHWAAQGKYLTIKVHDARPESFEHGKLIACDVFGDVNPCPCHGVDPTTGEHYCLPEGCC